MEKDLFNPRDTFNLISSLGLLAFICLAGSKLIDLVSLRKEGFSYWFYLIFFSTLLLLTALGIMLIYTYNLDKILWRKQK